MVVAGIWLGITEPAVFILAHQFRHVSSENNRPDTHPAQFVQASHFQTNNGLRRGKVHKTRQGTKATPPPSCHQTRLLVIMERRETRMHWTTPTLVEICIGLEINGYLPAEF